jgi:2-oxoglutarate ferredoxin oxidoreductase subunit alpha
MMLSDLDIGMNDWVVPRLRWDDSYRPDRGRVLSAAELEALPKFRRYTAENEDHVAARTLPGINAKGAFFTRGSGHNKFGHYTEIPDEYQEVMERLAKKHKAAAKVVPAPIIRKQADARIGIVSLGGCDPAVREGVEALAERGIMVDYLRVRAFPFDDSVEAFLAAHDRVFVVEQNRDAQMRSLLTIEGEIDPARLVPILHYDGTPITGRFIVKAISDMLAVVTLAPLKKALP